MHAILLSACLLLSLPVLALAKPGTPIIAAGAVIRPVAMDGTLNDPAWQHAGVIELTQQSPHPGQPTPFHTKVLLLRGPHTLYIAVIADDPDPAKIATHTLVRDGNQSNDDSVTVTLDTFDNQRYAYVFQVNAGGRSA